MLAGRHAAMDVYTPCTDVVLANTTLALRGHVRAGRWAQALRCCADWRWRAADHAPVLQAQADHLAARIRALELAQVSFGVDASQNTFGARALDKS